MITWNDTTSYSKHDTKRIPNCWTGKAGILHVTVVYGHIYNPNKWVMHCRELAIDTLPLKAETAEQAQLEAIRLVRARLEGYLARLNAAEAV